MALAVAPDSPRLVAEFTARDGRLSPGGMSFLEQMWRQVVAGFVVVPCEASGTNALTLTPILHQEGGATYADGMLFSFVAVATSTGAVTAVLGDLPSVKVYKDGGATQAGSGDVVASDLHLAAYVAALDSGNGGLVLIGGLLSAPNSWTKRQAFAAGFAVTAAQSVTIASGAITITGPGRIVVDTEGGAATDDLDTINGGSDGDVIFVFSTSGARVPTVKNGTGNAVLPAGDAALNSIFKNVAMIYSGAAAKWIRLNTA